MVIPSAPLAPRLPELIMDTSINRSFTRRLEKSPRNKHLQLRYGLAEWEDHLQDGWTMLIREGYGVQVSNYQDGCQLILVPSDDSSYWCTQEPLSERQAHQHGISEDLRQLLNEGLNFLQEKIPSPNTRVIDEDYIEEHRSIDEYEDRLRNRHNDEQEIQAKLRQRREENRRRLGTREISAPPRDYGLWGLEKVMTLVERGHPLGTNLLTDERVEKYRDSIRDLTEKVNDVDQNSQVEDGIPTIELSDEAVKAISGITDLVRYGPREE